MSRRLAAFAGAGFLGIVKDKNWSPFVGVDNRTGDSRLLWSYMLEPHIVCENDVDLRIHNVDCVVCKRKYATNSKPILQAAADRVQSR